MNKKETIEKVNRAIDDIILKAHRTAKDIIRYRFLVRLHKQLVANT